jgi:flavin-dependent dehydrogenase
MSVVTRDEVIQIAGAGPAGLAAAIALARAGRRVIVHEAQREVGYRFQGDLQGLENWTTERDVLDELREMDLTTAFAHRACREGTAFDAWGQAYPVRSAAPLFYMVERGPGSGSLDTALFEQAHALSVEVRFGSRLEELAGPGILAVGPKAADAIAVGYHFDTDMDDGFWTICDETLAPQGYAYLLVMNGRGTVKSCMYTGFKQEALYVQRTVAAFERLAGLKMENARPHGGVGNFHIPASAWSGRHPVAGEQAGFQDTLWGFGMRLAIRSGVLAARSLLNGGDYEARWRKEIGPWLRASVVNRALYGLLGNAGYRWALRQQVGRDARVFLRRLYRPSFAKRLLMPWARWRHRSRRRDTSCNHVDCACIWCRCAVPR